jgi:hypothetical protein
MTNKIEGGCRCGAVRYTLDTDVLPRAYACHCHFCQTWSGSAFSLQVPLVEASLRVSGEPVIFELTGPSGAVSRQRMCGVCHTRVFNTNSARPGVAMLRAGTLDRSDELDVVAHIWTRRKQRWITIPAGVPTWPESWTAAEAVAAMA